MNAEILSVGTELLLGDILNTDAQFLARELALYGVNVHYQSTVGDNPGRLKEALRLALSRCDIVITSGGLGPTADDLTRETICEVLGVKQALHEPSMRCIEEFFKKLGRPMTESNRKQAMLPEGCIVFDNPYGTAPGCAIEKDGKHVLMLPGPPRELKPMFRDHALPYLARFSDGVIASHSLQIFGVGESRVEEIIRDLMDGENPTTAPYAKDGEVHIRVTAKAATKEQAERMIVPVVQDIRSRLGDSVYGENARNLQEVVCRLLKEKGLKLATAESCTGGLLSKRLTEIPGSSEVFECGIVSYANAIKSKLLGVKPETLDRFGAVSKETACAMARGALLQSGADLAVSITGIAGPGGGTDEKPVGTVYVALSDGEFVWIRKISAGHTKERDYIRTVSASHALDLVRRYLEALPGCLKGGIPLKPDKKDVDLNQFVSQTTPVPAEKKKRCFLAHIFPWKGDSAGEVVRKIIVIIAFITFVVSAAYLVNYYLLEPTINDDHYRSVQAQYTPSNVEDDSGFGTDVPSSLPDIVYPEGMSESFKALYARNQDVMGWVKIDGTNINYPVTQTTDNDYYLTHDFDKNYTRCGTPFFDYRNALDGSDKSIIIYGHYMRNGQMFGNIEKYKDLQYYRDHSMITMNTIYEENQWKIFSVFYASTKEEDAPNFYYLHTNFNSEEDFLGFVDDVRDRSLYDIPVDVTGDDQILMLSTCSHIFDDARMVLVARRVRDGEEASVDVGSAVENPDCLMPEVWYRLNPDITHP